MPAAFALASPWAVRMAIDHDQLSKQLGEHFFREWMELFLPEEARRMDFGRVSFLPEEMFTAPERGEHKRLDLVVKVGLAGAAKVAC